MAFPVVTAKPSEGGGGGVGWGTSPRSPLTHLLASTFPSPTSPRRASLPSVLSSSTRRHSLAFLQSQLVHLFTLHHTSVPHLSPPSSHTFTTERCPVCLTSDTEGEEAEAVTVLTCRDRGCDHVVHTTCLSSTLASTLFIPHPSPSDLHQPSAILSAPTHPTPLPPAASPHHHPTSRRIDCTFDLTIVHWVVDVAAIKLSPSPTPSLSFSFDPTTQHDTLHLLSPSSSPPLFLPFSHGRLLLTLKSHSTHEEWTLHADLDLTPLPPSPPFSYQFIYDLSPPPSPAHPTPTPNLNPPARLSLTLSEGEGSLPSLAGERRHSRGWLLHDVRFEVDDQGMVSGRVGAQGGGVLDMSAVSPSPSQSPPPLPFPYAATPPPQWWGGDGGGTGYEQVGSDLAYLNQLIHNQLQPLSPPSPQFVYPSPYPLHSPYPSMMSPSPSSPDPTQFAYIVLPNGQIQAVPLLMQGGGGMGMMRAGTGGVADDGGRTGPPGRGPWQGRWEGNDGGYQGQGGGQGQGQGQGPHGERDRRGPQLHPGQNGQRAPVNGHQPNVPFHPRAQSTPPLQSSAASPPPLAHSTTSSSSTAEPHLVLLAKSQAGSRLLQTKLSSPHPDPLYVSSILADLLPHLPSLMCDLFGNYAVQKLIEATNAEQRGRMLHRVMDAFSDISCDRQGTRAMQKLMEGIERMEDRQWVVNTLLTPAPSATPSAAAQGAAPPRLLTLIKDPNGSHVVDSIITHFPPTLLTSVHAAALKAVRSLGLDQHGLCILKKSINLVPASVLIPFALTLVPHLFEFVNNAYGNYLIQHLLHTTNQHDHASYAHVNAALVHALHGHLIRLSRAKYSSNVVEKLLRMRDPALVRQVVRELVSEEGVMGLLSCTYGSYVLVNVVVWGCEEEEGRRLMELLGREEVWSGVRKNQRIKWERAMQQYRDKGWAGIDRQALQGKGAGGGGGGGRDAAL